MKLIHSKAELLNQEAGLDGVYRQIELAGRTCYRSQDKITEDSAKGFVERMIKSGHTAMLEHGTVYLYLEATPDNTFSKFEHPNIGFTAHYNRGDVVGAIRARYAGNPYSKSFSIHEGNKYITAVTTNLRVIIENGWEDDLRFISAPTKYHEKRYSVRFTTDRGVSHELVRHRVFSFAQESTRYCNYSKDKFGNELTFIIPSWLPNMEEYIDECGLSSVSEPIVRPHEIATEYKYYLFGYAMYYAEEHYLKLLSIGASPQEARQVLPNALKTEIVMTGFVKDWRHFFDLRLFGKTGKPHPDMQVLADKAMGEFIKAGLGNEVGNYESISDQKVPW